MCQSQATGWVMSIMLALVGGLGQAPRCRPQLRAWMQGLHSMMEYHRNQVVQPVALAAVVVMVVVTSLVGSLNQQQQVTVGVTQPLVARV